MPKTKQPTQPDASIFIQLLTAEGPVAADAPDSTFRITPDGKEIAAIRVAQLPHVGELLRLEEAHYKVVLVVQQARPWPEEQSSTAIPLTADVYAIRVNLLDEIRAVAPAKPWRPYALDEQPETEAGANEQAGKGAGFYREANQDRERLTDAIAGLRPSW